jgi:hypothetical protein
LRSCGKRDERSKRGRDGVGGYLSGKGKKINRPTTASCSLTACLPSTYLIERQHQNRQSDSQMNRASNPPNQPTNRCSDGDSRPFIRTSDNFCGRGHLKQKEGSKEVSKRGVSEGESVKYLFKKKKGMSELKKRVRNHTTSFSLLFSIPARILDRLQ